MENLYMVLDFQDKLLHSSCVQAHTKEEAIEGFNAVNCERRKVSKIKQIPINSKAELDGLQAMEKSLVLKSLEDYIYYNPIGGYWLRDLDINDSKLDILNILPDEQDSKKVCLFYVNIAYQTQDAYNLAHYIGNLLHVKSLSYSTYDYRKLNGDLNLSVAKMASDDYDEFAFVFDTLRYDDLRNIYDEFYGEDHQPTVYLVSPRGKVEELEWR